MSRIINFSGHALSDEAIAELLQKGDSQIQSVPPFQINFEEDVHEQLRSIIAAIEPPLNGSEPLVLILPGHSVAAVLLLMFIHGAIGHFPSVCLLQHSDSSDVYKPVASFVIDSRAVRMAGRSFRQEVWNK